METIATICFAAGNGGGHILPTITKAYDYKATHPHHHILFFATTAPLDIKILKDYSFIDHLVLLNIDNIPSLKKWWRLPLFTLKFMTCFFKSLWHLYKHKPSVIISMGGIPTIPICLAGLVLRIPLELYELNVEPGKAISFLAPYARTIWITYKKTATLLKSSRCIPTSYPIRFTQHHKNISRDTALETIGLTNTRKTMLIIGGSQGSLFINKCIQQWLKHSSDLHSQIQIIHQIGSKEKADWIALYAQYQIPSIVFDYRNDLASMYQAADLVICRAGAGTLAELLFFEKQSIIIPLESSTTHHQLYNAQEMSIEYPTLFKVLQQSHVESTPELFNQMLTDHLS